MCLFACVFVCVRVCTTIATSDMLLFSPVCEIALIAFFYFILFFYLFIYLFIYFIFFGACRAPVLHHNIGVGVQVCCVVLGWIMFVLGLQLISSPKNFMYVTI